MGATVDTSPWEEHALTVTLRTIQPTAVLALLGTTRARAKEKTESAVADTYEDVDYGLTAMLLRAAQASGASPRFVYLSSLGADAPRGNAYLAVRCRMERELAGAGLPYAVARPAIVSGSDRPEPRRAERAAAVTVDWLLKGAASVGFRGVQDKYASLDGRQLGRALAVIAAAPNLPSGEVFPASALRKLSTSAPLTPLAAV
jgi:uncharacterized protein YbjT (DUF2867 family)